MTIILLEWVFTSAFLILVVLALRAALGKRIGAGLRYALWAVVLVRLLVPVQLFASPLAGTRVFTGEGPEHSVQAPEAPILPTAPVDEVIGLPAADKTPGTVPSFPNLPAMPDAPEPPAAPDWTKAPAWLGWLWLTGAGLAALVLLLSNLRFYGKLRRARVLLEGADCPLRVYEAVGLPSPCLFGLARPAVYVTPEAAADPVMLRHVLAHEYTHYKQGDHIWSLLRCIALAVHWWNPLVWLAAGLSRRDGELACDEGALRRLGDGQRAAYGNTLLALVTAKPGPSDLFRCATTMAGDKKSLKERITRIAGGPKRWLWAAVAVVLVTALACACAFGQAEPEKDADPDPDPDALLWPYGVSEMTYVRDAGGFGGDFTVTLRHDGSFSYYAGLLSSYIGMGRWTQEDGMIRLADEGLKGSAGIQDYYFKIEDGDLIFQAEKSAKFMYVDVQDGERFSRRADGTDELKFSLQGNGDVAVSGTVDGLTLGEGTYWHPAVNVANPMSYLTLENSPYIAGNLEAWWDDDDRTSVMVSTQPMASRFAEDDPNTGFWAFRVNISDGMVIDMGSLASTPGKADSATLRFYPESVSEEEAIAVARLAARLLTEAENWYLDQTTPEVELACDTAAVPRDVLDAAKGYAAAQFRADVPGGVLNHWGESYNEETEKWEPVPLAKAVPFDRVRISRLDGPYPYAVQIAGEDVETELWDLRYEYHTTEPDYATILLAGGMTLDDEGWMNFAGSVWSYLVFTGEGEDRTAIPFLAQADFTSVGFHNQLLDALEGAGLGSGPRYQNADRLGWDDGTLRTVDLNRNGVEEYIQTCDVTDGGAVTAKRVEVWEDETLLFAEEGFSAHAGWTALFLCTLDGEDYLLRYHPTMYGGACAYTYELFTLENGRETTVRENQVEFDINFQPWLHEKFDPEAIAAFMDEVNGLLSHSVQLLNTDQDLLPAFEKNGRLYDDLWWLDARSEKGFVRDPAKSLLENLRDFQTAMEGEWDDPWGLTLTAGSPSPTGVVLNFIQAWGAPSGELQYGSRYWLEREDGGEWAALPVRDAVWTQEAYPIPRNGQRSEEVDWSELYGELPPGQYRIGKEITDFRAAGDYDTQTYYASFFVD